MKAIPLGKTELEVLQIVWELEEATVNDVRNRILKKRQVAYTTIMTVMKNLTEKGALKYRKEGNAYVYSATRKQDPEKVKSKLLNLTLEKVFNGSAAALVQTLVQNEQVSKEELAEIKKLIDNMEER
ncbi:MAG: BlaI/MecI/CopY family transcriptional regulator [bacterium]|nr:BlaI/MecI/CopY family transcriptional regulator [bacterium]